MNDRSTTGDQGQRSAIGQQQTNYSFPKSRLGDVSGELQDFVLVSRDGRIWTSAPDNKNAHQMLTKALDYVKPEGVSG